jgi:lipopolysaccharide/colanic/teichoic acid biosynthesis glycosyltransferase
VISLLEEDVPRTGDPLFESFTTCERNILSEKSFKQMIAIERRRTERTKDPFLLVLVEIGNDQDEKENVKVLDKMLLVLLSSSRETDVVGWYKDRLTVGAMFTALEVKDKKSILSTVLARLNSTLDEELTFDQFDQVRLSFHFFPDSRDHADSRADAKPEPFPDLANRSSRRWPMLTVKRGIDLVGSLLALIVCAPSFLAIGLAIKLSSRGPVFSKHRRVGQHGRPFSLLRFRTTLSNHDHGVHRDGALNPIATQLERKSTHGQAPGVGQPANGRRLTSLGSILRRSSLDDLPQVLNVFMGDMSLVGPRPVLPYKLATYQTWHRRRILGAKPGLTGLWQVTEGTFVGDDKQVSLDLRYATSWSLWLDLRILLRTPLAVLRAAVGH